MGNGKIRYALRLKEDGTLLSDITLWKLSDEHFEIMSGHPADITDLCTHGGTSVHPLTQHTSIFAVQGPEALRKLKLHCNEPERLARLKYFEHTVVSICDVECRVGRLGYTGESGFELICPKSAADPIWNRLCKSITPAGFIAADILRIEAGFPLFWNDFALPVTPWEAGLDRFCGEAKRADVGPLKRICFSAKSSKKPTLWRFERPLDRPTRGGELAVTSACYSARASGILGLGYVLARTEPEQMPLFDPTGLFTHVRAEPLPFYDPTKARPRADWS